MTEQDYDFMVGFTIFTPKGFKTMYRHFDNLETAKLFASNKNLKDNCKIYVDLDLYNKEKEKNKELEESTNKMNIKIHKLLNDNMNLLKESPYNKKLNYKYIEAQPVEAQWYKSEDYIKKMYISKDKIKAKIEESKKKYNDLHTKHIRDCGVAEQRELAKIEFGQSLLEDKE